MKHSKFSLAILAASFFIVSCSDSSTSTTTETTADSTGATAATTDMATLKQEIQEVENAYAKAESEKNVEAVANMYAEDAQGLEQDAPMSVGRDAIKASVQERMAKRTSGTTVTYDVMDVYGGGQYATEVGKSTWKDSTGNVTSTGKYMAIWEKRDGKWVCIRDIGNGDKKMD